MNLIPAEILELVSIAHTKARKIELLHKYSSPILLQILKHTYEPRITYDVNTHIKWTPDDAPIGVNPSNLWQEFRKIKYFYNSPSNMTPHDRREKVLKDILESVHSTDAMVFLGVIDKDLHYSGIDAELVLEAYPGLWDTKHPANVSEEKIEEIIVLEDGEIEIECFGVDSTPEEDVSEINKLDDVVITDNTNLDVKDKEIPINKVVEPKTTKKKTKKTKKTSKSKKSK